MRVSLYAICHFSLVAFKFYLSLTFVSLITVCLGAFLIGFIFPGTLCASWTCLTISFPMFGMFSAIISSNIFSGPFCLYSPSGNPIMQMLVHLIFFQRSLMLSSFLLFIFLYSVLQQWFLPFCTPGHLSVLLLLIPSNVLFISVSLFS